MLTFESTAQFRRDVKRAIWRGCDLGKLEAIVSALLAEKAPDARHKDHALAGSYAGFRECHILPDWLLVYRIDKRRLILIAARTGTHSDPFGE